MGHRQYFFPSQTSDMGCEHISNHPYPEPNLCLGIAVVLVPCVPCTAAVGVNPVPYFDITPRSNNIPSSNFSLEIPNYSRRINPIQDPFPHSSSASSSNHSNYNQGGPSCYDGFAINSHMDYERAPYKRKTPVIPMAFDRGNNNSYHSNGSSSLSISSVNLQANPTSAPQHLAWDPNGMPSSYRSNNLLAVGEESQRNVRSRQSLALQLGNNRTWVHRPSSNLPHHLHPTSNTSGPTVAGQWGYIPASLGYDRRTLSSGAGGFNHEMNQSLAGSSGTNSSMEIDGGYHQNLIHNRGNPTPLPTPHGPSVQVVSAGQRSHDQRTHPHRVTSSYQPSGFAAPLADGRRQRIEVVPPPRHSRPQSIIGQSSERHGRSRGLYDRFQPFSFGNNSHSGWVSEERTFYDSRNLFDRHSDLRLDIDNMSYEELLALEERIGDVSIGLSGDSVSRCLVETAYSPSNQIQNNQEERNCIICLEEYKDKEIVGRLTCGHDFHSNCIKKWLSIKSACPVCKASALPDGLKEK